MGIENLSREISAVGETIGLAIGFIGLTSAVFVGFLGLRNTYPAGVRVISYIFSLAFWATLVIVQALIELKQIGPSGAPLTRLGAFVLTKSMPFLFDIKSDFYVVTGMTAVVILPQLSSYLFCGIYGCALAPIWIAGSIDLVFLGMAKAFSVAAGVFTSFTLFFGILRKWPLSFGFWNLGSSAFTAKVPDASDVLQAYAIVIFFMIFSVSCLCLRFAYPQILLQVFPFHNLRRRVRMIAEHVHKWAIQHDPPPTIQEVPVSLLLNNLEEIRLLCEAAAQKYAESAEASGRRAAPRD
jgi:hypothetical protein